MTRRTFLPLTASALAAQSTKRYRVALIGHTGRGNFGHDWDRSWNTFPNVEVVAVADPVEAGRRKAMERSGAKKGYADYREMLGTEKPDIVTICPRWLDQRVPMFTACAEAGAHILLEKPLARNLEEADQLVAAAERARIKVQVGHTARPMPVTAQVGDMLKRGELGALMEIRGRGKEDRRAGGEDMMVLGTHVFDLMRYYGGDPEWVMANITEKGRAATREMEREGTEPIGRIAGDQVSAMFGFPNGVPGFFGSKRSDVTDGARFGVSLYGSKGMAYIPLANVPGSAPYVLRGTAWVDGKWERVEYPPEPVIQTREQTNAVMAADLLAAIEKNREPVCSVKDARWTIEMLAGIYQSHYSGARVRFPLGRRGT
jgi:predicted dehydrogenase